jgi:hypothetical protein
MTRQELINAMSREATIDKPHAEVCLQVMLASISGLFEVLDGKAVVAPGAATTAMIYHAILTLQGVNMQRAGSIVDHITRAVSAAMTRPYAKGSTDDQ